MIRFIEELSMNAWPALQTMLYDGWVLRFANGYTKRANSINPLYPSSIDIHEKIQTCEKIYQDKNLPIVFKMTHDGHPKELDAILSAQGYRKDSDTSVQVLGLMNWPESRSPEVTLTSIESEEWHTAFTNMNEVKPERAVVHRKMLDAIIPVKCYASYVFENRIAACGLGVLQHNHLGLFDIVTDKTFRRIGFSERLMYGLLSWAKQQGAQKTYLQVMLNNAPALRLYEKLGFKEAYQYWYRLK
jgi:GNAT superfamily N-acetyltransferase